MDAWLERSAKNLPPQALVRLLDAALTALWARTRTTLGEVTLTAIAQRVVLTASEKYPFFASLKVDSTTGFQCGELAARIGTVGDPMLLEGVRSVLVEFLTVLGNLTAEILTPELRAELSNLAVPEAAHPIHPEDAEDEDPRS